MTTFFAPGAFGLIGRHLVRRLMALGHGVTALAWASAREAARTSGGAAGVQGA